MAYRISARLDKELDAALRAYARDNGLSPSQALRELLRQSLSDAEPVTRGWREGFAEGKAEVLRAQSEALQGIEHP
jgi:hypothetical protein